MQFAHLKFAHLRCVLCNPPPLFFYNCFPFSTYFCSLPSLIIYFCQLQLQLPCLSCKLYLLFLPNSTPAPFPSPLPATFPSQVPAPTPSPAPLSAPSSAKAPFPAPDPTPFPVPAPAPAPAYPGYSTVPACRLLQFVTAESPL